MDVSSVINVGHPVYLLVLNEMDHKKDDGRGTKHGSCWLLTPRNSKHTILGLYVPGVPVRQGHCEVERKMKIRRGRED